MGLKKKGINKIPVVGSFSYKFFEKFVLDNPNIIIKTFFSHQLAQKKTEQGYGKMKILVLGV